jgi:hypothetical protein
LQNKFGYFILFIIENTSVLRSTYRPTQLRLPNTINTIAADLFSIDWIIYALAAIGVIVVVRLFFIAHHRMR